MYRRYSVHGTSARWGGEKEPSSLCGGGKDAILLVACVRTHFGF